MTIRGALLLWFAPSLLGLVLGACATDGGGASCPAVPLYNNREVELHDALAEARLLDENKVTAYQAEALASSEDPALTEEEALDVAQRRAACEYVHAYDEPFSEQSGCIELPAGYCP